MLNAKPWSARVAAVMLGVLAVALPSTSRADETAICNEAYEGADVLVKQGGAKLLGARDKLRICARPSCKAWMVKECTKSLAEVEARIPSVVLVARDADGRDVVDVTVKTEDQVELTRRLDGRAVELGPGERTFRFVAADGRRATITAVIREGEKAQRVTVKLEAVKPAPVVVPPALVTPPATAPVVGPPSTPPPPTPAADVPAAEPAPRGSSLRTTGYVVAGLGAAGLLVGALFGVRAIVQKSDAACDAANLCDATALDSARTSATVSTIGLVAGGALLAGGIALVVLAPSTSRSSSAARLEMAPAVSQRSTGLTLRGWW